MKQKSVASEAAKEPEAAPTAVPADGGNGTEAVLSMPAEEAGGQYTNGEGWNGGEAQERAPSSGRAFQRVKAEDWLDKKARHYLHVHVLLCVA